MSTTMLHVRLDKHTKTQATEALSAMGLTLSDAVRMFLVRVAADKQLPFRPRVPNAQTRAAMAEAVAQSKRTRFATADALWEALEKPCE